MLKTFMIALLGMAVAAAGPSCSGQGATAAPAAGSVMAENAMAEKMIIDTDIGDDIDDAFALALALHSPELRVIGVTTTFGETQTRAQLVDRFLGELGRPEIPVAAGVATAPKGPLTQRRYAEGGHFAKSSHPDAVEFLLEQCRRYPGQITLIAIGPLMNVGRAIDRDPETFRKLKRVVMMGGSIKRGYGDMGYTAPRGPEAEWNIRNDIASAQKLFASGVPLFVMPLDSTQLKMDEVKRAFLFSQGTPTTGQETPTLFDPMTIAFAVNPALCPVEPMRIRVDDQGFTRPEAGTPNAEVCLNSNSDQFFRFYLTRVAER